MFSSDGVSFIMLRSSVEHPSNSIVLSSQ
uniref:Uncharacterized protein n=1 Tax=Anguilla anguilla TaxID=7936 RepID=A0A0E9UNJ5_ANGAN